MPGELTQKAREIKQALLDLQNAGMQTTANMQNVLAFLDRLASGKTLSGLDYLTSNLKELSVAMRELGFAGSDVTKATAQLDNLAKTTRVLTAEYNALRQGMGAKQAAANWMWRQPSGAFESDQQAYQAYIQRAKQIEIIEKARIEREARAKGVAVPMEQIIDPQLPQVNEQFFRGLGFSADATERLRKRLESVGFSSANVTRNVTEMSTGITQLAFKTQSAEGNIRTFHTTLDRTGNMLDDTQKRFRTFGSAIVRDTVEVLKWSIAIGLVYAPMRKLTELLQQAATIQSALADVQVALGKSTEQLGAVFEASAQIANETSSSIEGVIDGYREAYSASGSVVNQYQRVATANALLRDSMVLSKLAGIDQSAALDTLVGALRQSGRELYEGQQLLDGWVAVSKNANVSMNQLASTFAIVGTAAEDVGISVDQLNAIVGTLAEATKLSADETGNAIRGFISGFQSAKAEETLARFGISVRTTSGEVRSFVDLMAELSVLSQSGVLSQREVAEITNVIGGGFRRGAQLAALLENFNRVMELTEVSMNANGDAADALDIKMATLDSAVTRLGNSFTTLAQALGGEGGVLGIFTQIVNITTKVIQSVTSLVNALEGAAPILATLGVLTLVGRTGTGLGYLGRQLPAALSYLFSQNLGQQQAGSIPAPPGKGLLGGIPLQGTGTGFLSPTWLDLGRLINDYMSKALSKVPLIGGRLAPLGAGGLLVPGALVATQAASGQTEKAGITFGASVLTAIATGGSPIWTAAGAIIATAFYDKFLEFEPNFAQRWSELIVDAQRQADVAAGGVPEEERIPELEKAVDDSLSLMERFTINARTFFINTGADFMEMVDDALGTDNFQRPEKNLQNIDLLTQVFLKQRAGETVPGIGAGISEALLFGGGKPGQPLLDENTYKALNELFNEFFIEQIRQGLAATPTQQAVISTQERLAGIAATAAEDLVVEALDSISKGVKGSVEQYLDASKIQTALSLSASQLIVAIQTAQKAVPTTTLRAPGPTEAVNFVAGLTEEEARVLTQVTGEITTNFEKINALSQKGYLSKEDQEAMEKYKLDIETAVSALEDLQPALERATALREAEVKIKPIIDLPDKLSGTEQLELIQNAERYWRYILEKQGLTDEEIDAYVAAQQEKLIRADKEILDYRTKAPTDVFSTVSDMLGLGEKEPFQFMDLRDRLGTGQFDDLITRYQQIVTAFKTNVPGFELDLDPVTLILQDGFKNMDLDMRLFNLALQELIDIEKEQMVEGMFNLPAGSTFFVPFEPASLDARSRANDALQQLNLDSLFAQYPPDPNAFQDPVEQGAYSGVLAGIKELDFISKYEQEQSETRFNRIFEALKTPTTPTAQTPTTPPIAPFSKLPPGQTTAEYTGNISPFQGLLNAILGETAGNVLSNSLSNIGSMLGGWLEEGFNRFKENLQSLPPLQQIPNLQSTEPVAPGDISTMLNLNITSTSNVMLDSFQIGQAVQSYLEQSMLKYDDTAGSINKVVAV